MEKYGEFLFVAESNDIKECLDRLSEEDIESCCEYKIFNRGYDYFHDGSVGYVELNTKVNSLFATVNGRREYEVEIYHNNGEVHGRCSCEYYDVCKHIVSALLYVSEDGMDNIPTSELVKPTTTDSLQFFKSHLNQLKKEELVSLVMKFAPENYILQIQNSHANSKDANQLFARVVNKILGLFKDEKLLWDPSGMDTALMEELCKIKGLESSMSEQIRELILKIMMEIDHALDEGYLYNDNYYDEDCFESQQFNQYVISFVKQLPFYEKISFVQKLDDTLKEMSYTTFEEILYEFNACFTNDESKELAEYIFANEQEINESLISRLFNSIEEELSINEKEKILLKLSNINEHHFISFIELLMTQDKNKQAYDQIEKHLSEKSGYIENKILEYYLDLCVKTGEDLNKAALVSINHNPNEEILSKIKSIGFSDMATLEKILEEERPYQLLSYLEKQERLNEALELVSNSKRFYEDLIFPFFKRYKKQFTSEAEKFFIQRIDANLKNTGESYYSRIAEAIGQISQINDKRSKEILTDIRLNYKRRTKLMSMLKRFE